jgi:hypothetical protein
MSLLPVRLAVAILLSCLTALAIGLVDLSFAYDFHVRHFQNLLNYTYDNRDVEQSSHKGN